METVMPVGSWVSRTADSVRLTCYPEKWVFGTVESIDMYSPALQLLLLSSPPLLRLSGPRWRPHPWRWIHPNLEEPTNNHDDLNHTQTKCPVPPTPRYSCVLFPGFQWQAPVVPYVHRSPTSGSRTLHRL